MARYMGAEWAANPGEKGERTMNRDDRHERAKPVEFTEVDLRKSVAALRPAVSMSPDFASVIARTGLEVRVDFGKWSKRDTVSTLRVRLYDGSGGFRERTATAYGGSLSAVLVEAYAQYLAVCRRDQDASG